jgi:hydroxypyruvate reductase
MIAGGETTVTQPGPGRGGRNQELALAAVPVLMGVRNAVLVTLATDGEDGPTDGAGAVVTGETLGRALALGLDPADHLQRHDSNTLFEALGDVVRIGPTGTNVGDLVVLLRGSPP